MYYAVYKGFSHENDLLLRTSSPFPLPLRERQRAAPQGVAVLPEAPRAPSSHLTGHTVLSLGLLARCFLVTGPLSCFRTQLISSPSQSQLWYHFLPRNCYFKYCLCQTSHWVRHPSVFVLKEK